MLNLYIERMKSEKSNKEYVCLVADLGFAKQVISYDTSIMILLAGMTPQDFYSKTEILGSRIELIHNEKQVDKK